MAKLTVDEYSKFLKNAIAFGLKFTTPYDSFIQSTEDKGLLYIRHDIHQDFLSASSIAHLETLYGCQSTYYAPVFSNVHERVSRETYEETISLMIDLKHQIGLHVDLSSSKSPLDIKIKLENELDEWKNSKFGDLKIRSISRHGNSALPPLERDTDNTLGRRLHSFSPTSGTRIWPDFADETGHPFELEANRIPISQTFLENNDSFDYLALNDISSVFDSRISFQGKEQVEFDLYISDNSKYWYGFLSNRKQGAETSFKVISSSSFDLLTRICLKALDKSTLTESKPTIGLLLHPKNLVIATNH